MRSFLRRTPGTEVSARRSLGLSGQAWRSSALRRSSLWRQGHGRRAGIADRTFSAVESSGVRVDDLQASSESPSFTLPERKPSGRAEHPAAFIGERASGLIDSHREAGDGGDRRRRGRRPDAGHRGGVPRSRPAHQRGGDRAGLVERTSRFVKGQRRRDAARCLPRLQLSKIGVDAPRAVRTDLVSSASAGRPGDDRSDRRADAGQPEVGGRLLARLGIHLRAARHLRRRRCSGAEEGQRLLLTSLAAQATARRRGRRWPGMRCCADIIGDVTSEETRDLLRTRLGHGFTCHCNKKQLATRGTVCGDVEPPRTAARG